MKLTTKYFIAGVIFVLFCMVLWFAKRADATYTTVCHKTVDNHCIESQRSSCNDGWHNGGCVTPTPTHTPTPTLTPTPTPIKECEEDCEPTPEVTPIPVITPKPSQNTISGGEPYHAPSAPTCGGIYAKAADVGVGVRMSNTKVAFMWNPSTDPHDKQVLLYGPSANNLPYSVLDIPANVGVQNVDGLTSAHWFAQIGTWRGECISWSKVFDP